MSVKILCSTVSNALVKSKKKPIVYSYLSNDFNILSVTSSVAEVVDLKFRNPCCDEVYKKKFVRVKISFFLSLKIMLTHIIMKFWPTGIDGFKHEQLTAERMFLDYFGRRETTSIQIIRNYGRFILAPTGLTWWNCDVKFSDLVNQWSPNFILLHIIAYPDHAENLSIIQV